MGERLYAPGVHPGDVVEDCVQESILHFKLLFGCYPTDKWIESERREYRRIARERDKKAAERGVFK